jgi:hypothetical protein
MRGGLKVLSGAEVVAILAAHGFAVVGGTKHLKLRRSVLGGAETLVVPNHDRERHAASDLRPGVTVRPASGIALPFLQRIATLRLLALESAQAAYLAPANGGTLGIPSHRGRPRSNATSPDRPRQSPAGLGLLRHRADIIERYGCRRRRKADTLAAVPPCAGATGLSSHRR